MGKIELDHTGSGGGITLSSDGTNLLVGGSAVGGGDVVDDTSPQLGGTLDTNGNLIQFGDSSSATDDRLQFGASQDLEIYHNGSNSVIGNYTGTFFIVQYADDGNIIIRSDDGAGGVTDYFKGEGATGEAHLLYYGNEKLNTVSQGVYVTGNIVLSGTVDGRNVNADGQKLDGIEASADVTDATNVAAAGAAMTTGATFTGDVTFTGALYNALWDNSDNALEFADNAKAVFGTGGDLELYHDGTSSIVESNTAGAYLRLRSAGGVVINVGGTENALFAQQNGETSLYYDNAKKIKTTSTGIDVTGNITVSGTVDGRDVATDGTKLDGIEASADVTDAANVTAAGALMDSELTNLAAVKAIDQGLTTSSNVQFNNVTVDGNLTVGGTTTTINSTTVTVDDPIFTLGGDTAPTSDDNKDRGIEFRWHNGSAAKVGFFGFDDSVGKFTFIPDATNTSEVFTGTAGTIVADLEGTIQTAAQPNITSLGTLTSLTTSADASLNGITVGNQTIYRGSGALKLIGGGVQNSRNLLNLSNGAGATIYGGSASTNATLRSTYGITIDGGDGDVDITGNTAVTGNITVSGTVDGRDVATDGTKLDGIATGADVTPAWVPASDPGYLTSSISSAVSFADSTALTFGAGNDLSISHDGSNSIIADAGTGSLELRGSAIYFKNAAGTETGISFEQNNNVVIRFDNQDRITTTLAGTTMEGFVRHNGGTAGGIEGISGSTLTYRNYTIRTLVSSTSPSQIVSVPYTGASVNFRSIEATIQVKNTSTGAREIQKVMATTDGTNAYVTNYGEVSTTGSSLADFTVDLLSSNLRILATQGSTTQHEYKVHAILFTD